MKKPITRYIRKVAYSTSHVEESKDLKEYIKDTYDIEVDKDTDPRLVALLNEVLDKVPTNLIKACGIKKFKFEDLGPSREYFPNHGKYFNNVLILNINILSDPYHVEDSFGNSLNKFEQTLYHEFGHGLDEKLGEGKELSLQPEWLELSNWSEKPKSGLKRLIIREPGAPELKENWYYNPKAGFTRFYAKRSPLEDWADTFSYYVGRLKLLISVEKVEYFDNILKEFYQ